MHDAPRPNIAGGTYHVMNRGNRKAVIFEDKRMRRRFLRILTECLEIYRVKLLNGCLIDNHFHLDVVTIRANLSDFMRDLESRFADYSNWRFKRVGHVFQGPFRHTLIEHDLHLFSSLQYVFMNPVKAGIARCPEDCAWSTYAATVGLAEQPSYLSLDWLPVLFPATTIEESRSRLREVMRDDRPIAAYLLQNELGFNGDIQRLRPIRSYVGEQLQAARSLPPAPTLTELRVLIPDRTQFVYDARVTYGYRVAEIARALQLGRSHVSQIFWKAYRSRFSALGALNRRDD